MRFNIFPGTIISTTIMWMSGTQAVPINFPKICKYIGSITVTFSKDNTVTTYNAEVVITDEIDQYYSGI